MNKKEEVIKQAEELQKLYSISLDDFIEICEQENENFEEYERKLREGKQNE